MSSFNEDCRTGYETKYWKVLTKIAFSLKTKAEKKKFVFDYNKTPVVQ